MSTAIEFIDKYAIYLIVLKKINKNYFIHLYKLSCNSAAIKTALQWVAQLDLPTIAQLSQFHKNRFRIWLFR